MPVILNYSSFAQTFEIGMSRRNMTGEAKKLFEFMCDEETIVKNRYGNRYHVPDKESIAWYRGEAEVAGTLVAAAGNPVITGKAAKAFKESIWPDLINNQKSDIMLAAMRDLVRDGIRNDDATKEWLLKLYDDGDYYEFLAHTFLYAIVQKNTVGEMDLLPENTLSDEDQKEIDQYEALLRKHAKPKAKQPPAEIDMGKEITYVNQMLCAFSDVTGEPNLTREELRKYPDYIADFEEQRQCFYAAETIHEEARDTLRIKDKDVFDLVKKEIKAQR